MIVNLRAYAKRGALLDTLRSRWADAARRWQDSQVSECVLIYIFSKKCLFYDCILL